MTVSRRLVLGLAMLVCGVTAMAYAETAASPAVYVVTYLEVGAPKTAEAALLLQRMAAASRRRAGNLRYDVLQEIGRPSRFAIVEGWRDKQAFATQQAEQARGPWAELQALLVSPPDSRPSTALSVAPAVAAPPPGALYVLTHVDVVPPAKDRAIGLLERLAEDSRKESGVLLFDVLQQDSRPNHLTLAEAWRLPEAFEAHRTAASTRAFRDALLPLQGALYDERVYRVLG
jgi:quinol monooxygenase YgiN